MEEQDLEVEKLTTDLATTKKELKELQDRAESAEMNSRIPCLVLSGRAMVPRQSARPCSRPARPCPGAVNLGTK